MNAEEAVAKGCALYSAMLSPKLRMREYKLLESLEYPVEIVWETIADPSDTKQNSAVIFPKHYAFGKSKNITFTRTAGAPFRVTLRYQDPTAFAQASETDGVIAVYDVTGIPQKKDDQGNVKDADVRIKVRLSNDGIPALVAAEHVDKQEVIVEVPVEKKEEKKEDKTEEKKDEEAMETDADAKKADEPSDGQPMDTEETKVETVKKTKIKTVYVPVTITSVQSYGISDSDLATLARKEAEMASADLEAEAAANAKNALETMVYESRDNFSYTWKDFSTDAEKSSVNDMCDKLEDWLYDEGEDETRAVYEQKLAEMAKIVDPVRLRAAEWDTLPPAMENLMKLINHYKAEATSGKEDYAHIDEKDLKKIADECDHVVEVLKQDGKLEAYEKRSKTENPSLMTSDINMRAQNLKVMADKILSKPKPAPKKEEKKEENKEENGEAAEGDKMDTDTPEAAAAEETPAAAEGDAMEE